MAHPRPARSMEWTRNGEHEISEETRKDEETEQGIPAPETRAARASFQS
jgi:hypothetical protein